FSYNSLFSNSRTHLLRSGREEAERGSQSLAPGRRLESGVVVAAQDLVRPAPHGAEGLEHESERRQWTGWRTVWRRYIPRLKSCWRELFQVDKTGRRERGTIQSDHHQGLMR